MVIAVETFIRDFNNRRVTVQCSSGEERAEVIRFLVENGARHGSSGWSRKLMESTTIELSHWMTVYCGTFGIEFNGDYGCYTYADIVHLMNPVVATPVDDLL